MIEAEVAEMSTQYSPVRASRDGFPVELGTVYLTSGYVLAKQIAKEVGCPAVILPTATDLNEKGEPIHQLLPGKRQLGRYILAWLAWYFKGQLRAPTQPENALTYSEWLKRKGFARG